MFFLAIRAAASGGAKKRASGKRRRHSGRPRWCRPLLATTALTSPKASRSAKTPSSTREAGLMTTIVPSARRAAKVCALAPLLGSKTYS